MIRAKGVARAAVLAAAVVLLAAGAVQAITIDTVPVSNTANTGELSGAGAGGYGPDRICGAVDYQFNIGKYEVTAGQYTAFLNAVAGVDTYALYNTDMSNTSYGSGITRSGGGTVGNPYTYSVASDFTNRPVNYVSWGDSARFTNWLTNGQPNGSQDLTTTENGSYYLNGATTDAALLAVTRKADWKWAITSEDEWYKAAYYDPATGTYFDYPTSSNSVPGRDMTEATNPGNNANYLGSPLPIDSGKYTTVAGEFQLSDGPYGTFDQGGNVWEWNEAILYDSYRGLRGGSFLNDGYSLHASNRNGNYPSLESYNMGFRVSAIPEPVTMAMVGMGIAGLGGYIRRRMAR